MGYRTPITPVEATTTSVDPQPTTSATSRANSSACAAPTAPVATLAFLEITTTARALPPARWARLSVTLGPEKRLRVNTPAVVVPGGADRIITSLLSSLIPMLPLCNPNPSGKSTSGTLLLGTSPEHPTCQGPTSPGSSSFASGRLKSAAAVIRAMLQLEGRARFRTPKGSMPGFVKEPQCRRCAKRYVSIFAALSLYPVTYSAGLGATCPSCQLMYWEPIPS